MKEENNQHIERKMKKKCNEAIIERKKINENE
jgi:hypothetical protein